MKIHSFYRTVARAVSDVGRWGLERSWLRSGVHFWKLIVHKPFPHSPCFMAGSLSFWYIQLSSLNRSSPIDSMEQVKMSLYSSVFRFPCSITRGPSNSIKSTQHSNSATSKFHCRHYTCWQVLFFRHSPYPNPSIGLPHGIVRFITPNHTFAVVHCPVALFFTPL
jgi:hypothetical protein